MNNKDLLEFLKEYKANGLTPKVLEKYEMSKQNAIYYIDKYYLPLLGDCEPFKKVIPDMKPCQIASSTTLQGKKRVKKGLCFKCGRPRSKKSVWVCDYHYEKQSRYRRKYYRRNKK